MKVMRLAYPIWLSVFVILPLILLWVFRFGVLKRYVSPILLTLLWAIAFAFPWDYIAIRERVRYFTWPHILGTQIFTLPLEEWIFIIFMTALLASVTALLWSKYGVRE